MAGLVLTAMLCMSLWAFVLRRVVPPESPALVRLLCMLGLTRLSLSPLPVAIICFLRYGQLLEQRQASGVNTAALVTGCTNAAGLVVVGNFQVG